MRVELFTVAGQTWGNQRPGQHGANLALGLQGSMSQALEGPETMTEQLFQGTVFVEVSRYSWTCKAAVEVTKCIDHSLFPPWVSCLIPQHEGAWLMHSPGISWQSTGQRRVDSASEDSTRASGNQQPIGLIRILDQAKFWGKLHSFWPLLLLPLFFCSLVIWIICFTVSDF